MAGKLLKRWLALLALCCLPLTALAITTEETMTACLVELGEEWTICTDEANKPLFAGGGSCAVAFVTDGARVSLAFFERADGEWHDGWRMDEPLFGEKGLVPVALSLYEEDGELFLFCSLLWGEKLLWVTAQQDYYPGWGSWYVTEHVVLVPDEEDAEGWNMEGRWVYTNWPTQTPPLLEYFSPVAQEQESVVIEGNRLVHYPESRMDAHYTVPDGVEIIGEYAFQDNSSLIRVTLPESVRVIEDSAFAYCQNLRVVDMPSTLESLGENAFDCTYVQQLTIPDGLTELPKWAFAAADLQGTVVIPEGITNIGDECFVFNAGITDMYLPASLETMGGESVDEGWGFDYIYGFNHIDPGQEHMTVHAPAGTEAAEFAIRSGYPYVIEDARGGTDLPAMTALVQSVLDEQFPGAVVCENEYGFPCVTYSADVVFAYAQRETDGWYDEWFLCCFNRVGDQLTLMWANDALYGNEQRAWPETVIPTSMKLIGAHFTLTLQVGDETVIDLTFAGESWNLTCAATSVWYDDGDGFAYWKTQLALPVTDGPALSGFSTVNWAEADE